MDRRVARWLTGAAGVVVVALACSPGTATSPPAGTSAPAPSVALGSLRPTSPGPTSPLVASRAWIAYQTGDGTTDAIYLARTDGSEDHVIGEDAPGDIHHHPDWSPDGKQLLFDVQGEPDELWVVAVDGSNAHLATDCRLPDCVGATHAAWSHDGRRIAAAYAIGPMVRTGPLGWVSSSSTSRPETEA